MFPAISAEVNGIIDENPESAGEESDSSAESEGDRRETIRNQRQQGQDNFGSALLTLIRQIEVVEGEEGQGKQGELEWLVKLEKSKMAASSMFGQKKRTEELWNSSLMLSGQQQEVRGGKRALEYLELFIDVNVWNCLVTMTNLNTEIKRASGNDGGNWTDVTLEEMKAFIGLNIAMGIVIMPEARKYWEKKWLINVPSFAQVMSRNRFFQILRYLHI